MSVAVNPGRSFPLGATVYPEGVNFSVFAKGATGVELLLFEDIDTPQPERFLVLDRRQHRTYHYWHVFVPGLKAGQIYGYRVAGPWSPERGARFDHGKVLLDPYGRAVVVPPDYSRELAGRPGENTARAMKSVVADLAVMIGRGINRSGAPLPRPLFMNCTWEVSPNIPARRSPKRSGAPSPGSSRRSPT